MAQHIEIDISNQQPCKPSVAAGSYLINLHRWGSRGIEHSFIQTGRHDPTDIPIGELAQVMLRIAENRSNPYRNKDAVPLSKLVGMSVLRLCMHEYTTQGGHEDTRLQGELVGGYGFVGDVNKIYPAEYSWQGSRTSSNGVSTHVRVDTPTGEKFVTAQHLWATPTQEREFPVLYAAPSLAHVRLHKDAWIPLRPMPEKTSFVETLVSHEELLDTIELSV